MARDYRALAVNIITLAIAGFMVHAWMYAHDDPLITSAQSPSCSARYVPGPPLGDALLIDATAPNGWLNVTIQRLDGRTLWNTTLPDGEMGAWAFNATRGLVRVLCIQPTSPIVDQYAWIGNGTVLVGSSIEDLVTQAGVQHAS